MRKNSVWYKCKKWFIKMKWTKFWHRCVIGLCVLAVVALVVYNLTGDGGQEDFSFISLITEWGEVWVGLISAMLIVWQLSRETSVEEAQFITEYNRSFVENEHMTDIERYLECQMSGAESEELLLFTKERQHLVNYLVYLEGFSSCLLKKRIRFSDVDDLFAYRFFLALNHPEVQSIDLLPCACYYRSCYQVYDRWLEFRETCGKYSEEDDWEVPLYSSALHNYLGYEKYAFRKFRAERSPGQITVCLNTWKKVLKYSNYKRKTKDGETEQYLKIISFTKQGLTGERTYIKILRAALKELLYYERIEKIECDCEEVNRIWAQLIEARKILYQDGVHFRQLHSNLKISNDNLKRIAELVYHTDKYIYPDMFGSVDNAVAVLPGILRSGRDAMFNLDNLFVCELRDKIVGIILWHEGPLNWDRQILKEELKKLNKTVLNRESNTKSNAAKEKASTSVYSKEKFDCVCQQYIAGYEKPTSDGVISVLNVCVSEHTQRFGMGRKMLLAYLQQHTKQVHELCVLEENKGAVELYKKCGFSIESSDEAYPPGCGRVRLTMRKKPEK